MSFELDIKSFVALALGDDLKGGSIQVSRDPDRKGLFAHRLPLAQRKLESIVSEMAQAIELDWRASGKKEARTYQLTIVNAARDIEAQRSVSREAEPVTPADIAAQGAAVTLVALNDAAATIKQPFEQMKEVLTEQRREVFEPQRELLAHYREELTEARDRAKRLEADLQSKTDELREYKGRFAESERVAAEALKAKNEGEAALLVARAEANAIDKFTKAGVDALPQLAKLAARYVGGKRLGGLIDAATGPGDAPGTKPPNSTRKVDVVKGKATAFPADLTARIRALPITDLELARLLMYFWLLDPEGDALELVDPNTAERLFALLPEVHAHLSSGKAVS